MRTTQLWLGSLGMGLDFRVARLHPNMQDSALPGRMAAEWLVAFGQIQGTLALFSLFTWATLKQMHVNLFRRYRLLGSTV